MHIFLWHIIGWAGRWWIWVWGMDRTAVCFRHDRAKFTLSLSLSRVYTIIPPPCPVREDCSVVLRMVMWLKYLISYLIYMLGFFLYQPLWFTKKSPPNYCECLTFHHVDMYDIYWNILTTVEWITMKFGTYSMFTLWMIHSRKVKVTGLLLKGLSSRMFSFYDSINKVTYLCIPRNNKLHIRLKDVCSHLYFQK